MIRKWFASFLSLFAFAPSLAETQKANRLALADHLEQNVTDDQYNHQFYMDSSNGSGCALGHAAAAGIGGMKFDPDGYRVPIFEGVEPETFCGRPSYNSTTARASAKVVFGDDTYDTIFHADNYLTRSQAIERLRNYEPIAA